MGKRDPRVDDYIRKAAPFAQPILTDIRQTVHASCPDVEEAMKWSFPHFLYKGMTPTCRSTIARTRDGAAPSAIRSPISRVRCDTV